MLNEATLQMLRQLAHGLCVHFGSNCEVVVHDLSRNQPDSSIVLIENGHVSSRKVGDGCWRLCGPIPPCWRTSSHT